MHLLFEINIGEKNRKTSLFLSFKIQNYSITGKGNIENLQLIAAVSSAERREKRDTV